MTTPLLQDAHTVTGERCLNINEPATDFLELPSEGDTSQIASPLYKLQYDSAAKPLKKRHQSKLTKTGTIFSSSLNLTNTILGAGLLSLPYAFSKTGITAGFILFFICSQLSAFGLHLCGAVARRVPDTSYYKISNVTMPKLRVVVDLAVAIKCFGVGTSFLLVIGDLMPEAMKAILPADAWGMAVWEERRFWILVCAAIFAVPTVALKNLDSLKFASTFSLICVLYTVVIILLYAWDDDMDVCDGKPDKDCRGTVQWGPPDDFTAFCGVVPIFIFSFTCHQNMFTVANELRDNSQKRLNQVLTWAIGTCLLAYSLVAYSGYHTFGNVVESDFLKMLPKSSSVTVVRFAFTINLAFSYALQCHPCRNSVSNIIFQKSSWDIPRKWFYLITYSILGCSLAICMFVSSLGMVLAIVGATGSTTIQMILPGIFYFRIQKRGRKRWAALALAIVGMLLIPFSLTMVFVNAAKGNGGGE